MTPRLRALLGAACGAVLVLVAHPSTRPFMLSAFRPLPKGGLSARLARPTLRPPTDVVSGAAYVHEGAERLERGEALGQRERASLLRIAAEGERQEAANPFWPMSEFVFREGMGRAAREAWRRASRGTRYVDHQRAALLEDRDRLARAAGDVQAWIYAAVAPQRSEAMVEMVKETALRTLHAIKAEDDRVEFAYETIRNGALLRDGSERLSLGEVGIGIVEGATYPPELSAGIKRLWIAKTALTANLRSRGRAADAAFCDRQFRTNDSWQAFRQTEDPDSRFQGLAISAALVDGLPGGFLATALGGALIALFARRLASVTRGSTRFRGAGLTACSLGLLLAGAMLGYPVIGLTAGACALTPAVSVERPRRFDGSFLGPLHVLVVGSTGLALLISITLATISRSLPGQVLPSQGTLGAYLGDTNRLAAGAVSVLGASALVAPAWAIVRRYPTPALAELTYRNLGRGLATVALVLAIVSAPISLVLDRWLGNSLAEIALNEQIAYNPSNVGER